jgi:hypothetical protein
MIAKIVMRRVTMTSLTRILMVRNLKKTWKNLDLSKKRDGEVIAKMRITMSRR